MDYKDGLQKKKKKNYGKKQNHFFGLGILSEPQKREQGQVDSPLLTSLSFPILSWFRRLSPWQQQERHGGLGPQRKEHVVSLFTS